jgi:hypothetical protein
MLVTGAAGSAGKGKGGGGDKSAITEADTFYVCRECRLIHKSTKSAPGPPQHTVPAYSRGSGPATHARGAGWAIKSCSCKWAPNKSAQAPGKCTCKVIGGGP